MNTDRLDVPLLSHDQSTKDCKKQTPDFKDANTKKGIPQVGYRTKNEVYVNGISLFNKKPLNGRYKFDSYDSYDNTCYVVTGTMTYNVLLSDITLL